MIKGAPDVLLKRCSHLIDKSGIVQALDEPKLTAVTSIKDKWSSEGKRVILLARKVLRAKEISFDPTSREYEAEVLENSKGGLVLVGLTGIVDPPRPEIPEVVATLRRAGIRIFMVTGDFGLTALAIARQCGIVTTGGRVHDVNFERSSVVSSLQLPGNRLFANDSRPKTAHCTRTASSRSGSRHDRRWRE